MNRIEKLIAELCPDGVEWKKLGEVTIWDRRFIGVNKNMQKNVLSFKHISANDLKKLETTGGNIKLLSTGKFDGWTTEKLAEGYINEGEIISIPSGGSANIKYYNGKFVDSGNILAKSFDSKILNLKFCYYFLLTRIKLIESYFRGSGVKHPNMPSILNIPIPIPPLPIQEEIVKILDTFTELEAELELKLQAELEARKKQYEYYRNKLLTPVEHNGRWYLNGVEVEWKKLGEVGTLIRGSGLQKKDFIENGVDCIRYGQSGIYYGQGCIHYGQIYTYYRTFADRTISFVSETKAKKLKKAQKGDVLISGVSENIEDICKPIGWLGDEICISGDMFAFRHNQNTKYITYLLQTNDFKNYKRKYAQGTKVIRVKPEKILNYNIPIPPLSEQERIVAILDKFDALVNDLTSGLPAEIEARRKQYEYYRDKLLNFNRYHCRIDSHRENCKGDSHRENCKGDS